MRITLGLGLRDGAQEKKRAEDAVAEEACTCNMNL